MTDRSGAASVVLGDYVYVLGGFHQGEQLKSVERAQIKSDGTIETFATVADVSLVVPREFLTAAVVGNELFVLGGSDGTSPLDSVERAPINPDGSLGPFATISMAPRVTTRDFPTTTLVGSTIYVVGGKDTNKLALSSVEQATISTDGSLGAFATVTGITLDTPRYLHSTAIAGAYLYVAGGNNGTTMLASVERASINPDGSLGPFATITGGGLVRARMSHESVVVGGQLYVFGGVNGPAMVLNDVESAPVNADGSLGNFATVPGLSFVTSRVGTTMAVIKDYVYAFGGFGPQAPLNTIERAKVASDGSLGSFELL